MTTTGRHSILGEWNEEQALILRQLKRHDLAREDFNRLPYAIRTLKADTTNLFVRMYCSDVVLTFGYVGEDADEPCSEAVGKLMKCGVVFVGEYSLLSEHPEVWQRTGKLVHNDREFNIKVTGFSRPIGYDLVEEEEAHEAVDAYTSSHTTIKCTYK